VRVKAVRADDARRMADALAGLHTVCQEANCPNQGECFARRTATFMIMGDICTRACGFCAVKTGRPGALDPDEPERVGQAAAKLGLRHVVITSVDRDIDKDGGAGHYAKTISAVRRHCPASTIEVLIPDFKGSEDAVATVMAAKPTVLNHNVETVPRLYRRVRPQASYERSLRVIQAAKRMGGSAILTKSGFMLGLGEELDEAVQVLHDLRAHNCDMVTIGQYLQPNPLMLPVERYATPEEFDRLGAAAREIGFKGVASGPLVRSSYLADEQIGTLA